MERYDGKTRRQDYIIYGLITFGVVLVIVGLSVLCHFLKKANQKTPDYRVVIGSEEAFNEAMEEQLEALLADLVGDRNGDGAALVEVEPLRLVDYRYAQNKGMTGVTMDDDFNRMLFHVTDGSCYLYLLSDQPGGDFRGAATTYCEAEYFLELPEELQDTAYPSRMDLTDAPFLQDLGLEEIPFYGCVLDGGDSEEERFAVELLEKLRTARGSLF